MARTKKVEIITEAKPHTIKKFELIEKYVESWAYKILNYHGKPGYAPANGVIFIDCMSNSGVYRDIDGNRVDGTALKVAKCLNNVLVNYPDKKAILIFNDLESQRVDHLKSEIEKLQLDHVEVYYKNQDCNAFLRELDLDSYKNKYHTLAFDFGEIKDIVLFVIYFSVLAYLCIRNNNIYTNILLEFKGYKMYNCDIECSVLEQKKIYHDSLIISEDDLTQMEENEIPYWDFDKYIYIAINEGER